MATMRSSSSSLLPLKTLNPSPSPNPNHPSFAMLAFRRDPLVSLVARRRGSAQPKIREAAATATATARAMAVDSGYSPRRSGGGGGATANEPKETFLLPGCDYNHWLIVMEFPKDPAPTREQMIETYLNTLATVIGSMEEAKKNMYAFSTTTYTGFQCTIDEETSEKFKGLPGVLWVLPDSYIDVKNKDYGGDKYINGEIIPCKYPTYQPKQRSGSKYESRRYERRRDGSQPQRRRPTQVSQAASDSS